MSEFNVKDHLIKVDGKPYLPVPPRVFAFRQDHPLGSISTEVLQMGNETNGGVYVVRATVTNAEGSVMATAHGTARGGGKAKWSGRELEKAETAAIGRALANAGYGTLFAGLEDDEDQGPVDAPQQRSAPQQQAGATTRPANGNGRKGGHWSEDPRAREAIMTAAAKETGMDNLDWEQLEVWAGSVAQTFPTGKEFALKVLAGYRASIPF